MLAEMASYDHVDEDRMRRPKRILVDEEVTWTEDDALLTGLGQSPNLWFANQTRQPVSQPLS